MNPQEVLDFWFLPPSAEGHGQPREEWFRKDSRFDAALAERFGGVIAQALAGGLREWDREGAQGKQIPGTDRVYAANRPLPGEYDHCTRDRHDEGYP